MPDLTAEVMKLHKLLAQASASASDMRLEIARLEREVERLNLCLTIEKKLRHNAEIEAVRRD